MKEYNPEDIFEENVRRLIRSSASKTNTNADAAFQRKLTDSVLAEVERERPEGRPRRSRFILRVIMKSRITKVAAAIVVIAAISFSVLHRRTGEQPGTAKISEVAKSPAEMMTLMSLTLAYQEGGIEAVERQCEDAFELLGPWPDSLSAQELLAEFNGT